MTDVEMSNLNTTMDWSVCMETKIEDEDWVFVDLQGFKVNKNRFMCKEFCLISGDETFHAMVKSWFPYKQLLSHYKRQVGWLTDYFHGLMYDFGDMHIDEMTKIVYPKLVGKIIIVKGDEKIKWMKYIFRKYDDISCRNIEDFNYEMSQQSDMKYAVCGYHNARYGWRKCRCAMSNALNLQDISNSNAPIRFF